MFWVIAVSSIKLIWDLASWKGAASPLVSRWVFNNRLLSPIMYARFVQAAHLSAVVTRGEALLGTLAPRRCSVSAALLGDGLLKHARVGVHDEGADVSEAE